MLYSCCKAFREWSRRHWKSPDPRRRSGKERIGSMRSFPYLKNCSHLYRKYMRNFDGFDLVPPSDSHSCQAHSIPRAQLFGTQLTERSIAMSAVLGS